jgi:hypothetical protein
MHPQLRATAEEFQSALHRVRLLSASFPEEAWERRPGPGSWSATDCLAHLNLTAEAYLPLLRRGVEEARAKPGPVPARLRRDPIGWLVWRSSGPQGRLRVSTKPDFVPGASGSVGAVLDGFERLQEEKMTLLRAAAGLPIHRVKVASVFDPRIRYSLYSAFTILAAHQHRHLSQAERALGASRT